MHKQFLNFFYCRTSFSRLINTRITFVQPINYLHGKQINIFFFKLITFTPIITTEVTFDRALAIFSLINNDAVSCEAGVDANKLVIAHKVLLVFYLILLFAYQAEKFKAKHKELNKF